MNVQTCARQRMRDLIAQLWVGTGYRPPHDRSTVDQALLTCRTDEQFKAILVDPETADVKKIRPPNKSAITRPPSESGTSRLMHVRPVR